MSFKLPFKIAGIMGAVLLADSAAWADVLPGGAMPETVSKALQAQQPVSAQGVSAPIAPPKEKPSPLAEQAKKIKFQLNGIILEGNHVYTEKQLRPLYQDKLHKTISVADLFEIVQNITNYYRNNGYIISRAILPPQHVKNGIVRVRIIEGYIGEVNVSGNPHGAKPIVLAYGNKIKECRPLQLSRMEKYLLIANELPSTQVKAVLSPSKTKTGAADLTLVTDNKPVTGYVSYDNYGTRYIGPQQMTANLGINSFIASGDTTQATFTKTPKGGELTYTDINYSMPIGDEGNRWLIGGTRAHTHPLFVLQQSQIDGLNNNYYTNIQYPIIRTRTKSLTLRTGFNYLDSHVTTLDQNLYTDHIRSLDLGGTYNFSDSWYGANLISGDFRQGLPILGYTSNTSVTAQTSRPGGRGDYTKFTLQMSRVQALKGAFSLYGLVTGQYALNPLLASEQFTFGGSQLGRGYDTAELIGDKGAAGSLELRYDFNVGKFDLQSLQFYTFYDAGMIWNLKRNPGAPTKLSATSAGLGARFFFTKYVSGNIMWAQPLSKPVLTEQEEKQVVINGQTVNEGNGKAPRVFFSIVASLY